MCKLCGQESKRDMCPGCEGHMNCRATMAEAGLVDYISVDEPINYMPVSKED